MKVFKWDDYYDTENCPHCGRLRLMIAHTEYGTKRVCEKCGWCVEDNNYFVEDETVEEERREEELKPCPFCGGKAIKYVNNGVCVKCVDCGISTITLCDIPSCKVNNGAIERVIELWNRRANDETD